MDYGRFVRGREPLWAELEEGLERLRSRRGRRRLGYDELEGLALRYRQVLHDHALARVRFPGTGAQRRLERLSLAATGLLAGGDAGGGRRLRRFFGTTFPAAFRAHLGALAVALGLFAVGLGVGLFGAALRPGMAVAVLGEESVAGLVEGRLWTESLTTAVPPAVSSSAIATNNLSVALFAWSSGVVAGIGPIVVVLSNGLHLGVVSGMTAHYGMAGELFRFVVGHGILEITLLLVAAAGGLRLGWSLVAAGDRPRWRAVRSAGRSSLALLLGCLPWLAVLALVEATLSPAPELALELKLLVGLALEAAFLLVATGAWRARRGGAGREEPS